MLPPRFVYAFLTAVLAANSLMAQTGIPVSEKTLFMAGPGIDTPVLKASAPVLGYFVDRESGRLQWLMGLAGGGFLGEAIPSSPTVLSIGVSPTQDYMVGVLPNSLRIARVAFDGEFSPALQIPGAMVETDRIAFSPSGRTLLISSSITHHAQIYTGMPDSPVMVSEQDWSWLQGRVTGLAISDDGETVLVAGVGDTTSLYSVRKGASPILAYQGQTLPSAVFLPDSHDVLLAFQSENRIIWLTESTGPVPLADDRSGVSAPVAVASSADSKLAFVANSDGTVLAIPLAGGPAISISCDCQPSRLQRMRGRDVFLLTPSIGSSLTLLENDSERGMGIAKMPLTPSRSVLAATEQQQ